MQQALDSQLDEVRCVMQLKSAISHAENSNPSPIQKEVVLNKHACFAAIESRLDELSLMLGDQASLAMIYSYHRVNCITYRQYHNLLNIRATL